MNKKTKKMPIDAKTGRIVTAEYAKKHPGKTVVLTVKVGKKK